MCLLGLERVEWQYPANMVAARAPTLIVIALDTAPDFFRTVYHSEKLSTSELGLV